MSYLLFVKNKRDFLAEMEAKQVNIRNITGTMYNYLSQEAVCGPLTFEQGMRTLLDTMHIHIYCTIRTTYSNEVIVPKGGRFYTDCTESHDREHSLYDCILLAGRRLVLSIFDCGDKLSRVIERSTIYPVGALVARSQVVIYVTIVIDSGLKEESFFNLKDSSFQSIQSLTASNYVESQLLSKLVIVKGENENV